MLRTANESCVNSDCFQYFFAIGIMSAWTCVGASVTMISTMTLCRPSSINDPSRKNVERSFYRFSSALSCTLRRRVCQKLNAHIRNFTAKHVLSICRYIYSKTMLLAHFSQMNIYSTYIRKDDKRSNSSLVGMRFADDVTDAAIRSRSLDRER